MDDKVKSYRNLLYAVAKRAKELSDMKMDELRYVAGFDCTTAYEAQQKAKGSTRGQLIEEILTEEFEIEFDKEFNEE